MYDVSVAELEDHLIEATDVYFTRVPQHLTKLYKREAAGRIPTTIGHHPIVGWFILQTRGDSTAVLDSERKLCDER